MNGLGNCRSITIGGAALGGLLLWILLALGARGWFSSLLIAALLAVAAALLVLALICRDAAKGEIDAAGAVDRKEDTLATVTGGSETRTPETAPVQNASMAETGGRHAKSATPGGEAPGRVNDTAVIEDDDETSSDEGDPGKSDLGEEVSRTEALDREADRAEEDEAPQADTRGDDASAQPMPDAVAADLREKPELLEAPRGQVDDLKQLRGVGPRLEEQLNRLGVWHLRQIASWNEGEAAWIDDHLEGFKGRIQRDDWIGQARELTKDGA